jgi:ABC-type xylose transport system substrate-binding protein
MQPSNNKKKPYKEKTIKVTSETQERILKDALNTQRMTKEFGIRHDTPERREQKVEQLNEIEKLEKQLE